MLFALTVDHLKAVHEPSMTPLLEKPGVSSLTPIRVCLQVAILSPMIVTSFFRMNKISLESQMRLLYL